MAVIAVSIPVVTVVGGTPVPLAATPANVTSGGNITPPYNPRAAWFQVRASSTNTGLTYIGGPQVSASLKTGVPLAANDAFMFPPCIGFYDLTKWYIDGTTGDTITITYAQG